MYKLIWVLLLIVYYVWLVIPSKLLVFSAIYNLLWLCKWRLPLFYKLLQNSFSFYTQYFFISSLWIRIPTINGSSNDYNIYSCLAANHLTSLATRWRSLFLMYHGSHAMFRSYLFWKVWMRLAFVSLARHNPIIEFHKARLVSVFGHMS